MDTTNKGDRIRQSTSSTALGDVHSTLTAKHTNRSQFSMCLTRLARLTRHKNKRLFFPVHHLPVLKKLYLTQQEAQLSPRNPRDALYQLKCCSTVIRITQTVRVSTRGALSATATFYSATCIVFYMHRCTRHNYRTATMQCRACHQQTSV